MNPALPGVDFPSLVPWITDLFDPYAFVPAIAFGFLTAVLIFYIWQREARAKHLADKEADQMTKKPVFPIPAMIRGGGIVAILVWLFNSFLVFWNVEFNALPFSAGWMWTLIVGTLLMVVTFTFFSFK